VGEDPLNDGRVLDRGDEAQPAAADHARQNVHGEHAAGAPHVCTGPAPLRPLAAVVTAARPRHCACRMALLSTTGAGRARLRVADHLAPAPLAGGYPT